MTTQTQTQPTPDLFRRPADSTFDEMRALLDAAQEDMQNSREVRVPSSAIQFSYDEESEALKVQLGAVETQPMTAYSLGQVAGMARIPTQIIERLYAKGERELVVDNLNALFPRGDLDNKMALVRDVKDDNLNVLHSFVRAMNGNAYSRLWDCEVFQEIDDFLIPRGFSPKIPSSRPGSIRNGLMHNLRAGLFRGDQTSFGFFFAERVDPNLGKELGGMIPGMMVWNSEVGARSFGFHTFYFHEATGSIIIWTPSNHRRKRFVHRGNIKNGFGEYLDVLEDTAENFQERYLADIETFRTAMTTPFAPDADAAVQKLNEWFDVPKPEAEAIIKGATRTNCHYGDPLSVWRVALSIAYDAGITSRAEVLVDQSMLATKVIRKCLKV